MNNLARIRELRGLSQRDLADMINVSQPTIQRAESESPTAKLETYKQCARVLNVSLIDIFDTRTDFAGELADLLRRIPPEKHDRLLELIKAAQGLQS